MRVFNHIENGCRFKIRNVAFAYASNKLKAVEPGNEKTIVKMLAAKELITKLEPFLMLAPLAT